MKNLPNVVKKYVADKNFGICISSITLSELYYGINKSVKFEENKRNLLNFMLGIRILNFDENSAIEYGRIRANLEKRGLVIGSFDMLIASHAKANDLVLVTNNTKEFERIEGLKIENWT